MAHEPVRFGVLGAGRIARNAFVPGIQKAAGAELHAVASRDLGRARSLGGARSYDEYDGLLADPDVEAVYIATHNGLHRDLTLKALDRGKHVLCEKPLGRNAAECEELVAAARQSGLHVVEAFMYRHHPQIARARGLVDTGAIGELRTVEAAFSFHLTRQDDVRLVQAWGGGALLDVGCYCVNVSRLFLGNEPESVTARASTHPEHGVDMALHGVLDYGEGRFAVISCGFDAGLREHVALTGTGGVVRLTTPFLSSGRRCQLTLDTDDDHQTFEFEPGDNFQAEIEDLARCIRQDATPLLPPDEGLHNARIMDALLAAARG